MYFIWIDNVLSCEEISTLLLTRECRLDRVFIARLQNSFAYFYIWEEFLRLYFCAYMFAGFLMWILNKLVETPKLA